MATDHAVPPAVSVPGSVQGDVEVQAVNTIRTLAMDAVQAANSGHPGTPMAMAPVAYCLWQRFLRFDPEDPKNTTALNPTLLFEVLSPSTEAYDRGTKARNYRLVPSLKAYAFVEKDRPCVELHYRQVNGEWAIKDVQGMEALLSLDAIAVELPLAEIYAKVDFQADAPSTPA